MPFPHFAPIRAAVVVVRTNNAAGGLPETNAAVNDLCLQVEQLLDRLEQLLREMSISTDPP